MWVVAKPFDLPRKRGNPKWGKPPIPVLAVPIAFDNRCYIPEWLLKRWQISVDPNVSG
jgi:hypothetical protein